MDAWDVPIAWNWHHVDVVIAVPVFGVSEIVEIKEPSMESDAICDRSVRRQAKTTDEHVLDRGMCQVEVVVPHDEIDSAAGRNEPPESPEDLRMSVCDQSEPLDACGNGPAARHVCLESRQVEHVAEDDNAHPGAGTAELAGEVLDETGECERRVLLVRGGTSVPGQMEIAHKDEDLVSRDRYVRVPSDFQCLRVISSSIACALPAHPSLPPDTITKELVTIGTTLVRCMAAPSSKPACAQGPSDMGLVRGHPRHGSWSSAAWFLVIRDTFRGHHQVASGW